ncbi:MAG: hypothetical protein EBU90_24330 [Proteobacteria bacterium]|nr:hypothetical protein [Pseudomonadota bacterium]
MFEKLKSHFSKSYNLVFWILFGPAMLWTLFGVQELYTTYFDLLTKEDHMQFFLRFFFPISVGLLVTALERRQRLRRQALVKGIEKYLKN